MTTIRQLLREKGHKICSVGPESTVYDAIRKMADEDIGSLVVMDRAGRTPCSGRAYRRVRLRPRRRTHV
jgi:predicted transcriptional regulator